MGKGEGTSSCQVKSSQRETKEIGEQEDDFFVSPQRINEKQ
jgi:hypothetical protein